MSLTLSTDKMVARIDGAIGHMIFNNVERHNAVSMEMWDAAEQIIDAFAEDDAVRVMVISGAGGKAFVSGADISKFEKERGSRESVDIYNARVSSVYRRIESFAKPTIAMINGYCLGGGLNLAASADIRICSGKSKFGMPAAKLALGYPFDSIKRLITMVGAGYAKDMMFSARTVEAAEAFKIGLVQRVVPEAELEGTVTEYAERIAGNAPLTVKAMKFISGQVIAEPDERDMEKCVEMVRACFDSEDYKEGRKAFMEKRKPNFQGK